MKNRAPDLYVSDILEAIKDVFEFVKGTSFETFKGDKKTVYSVIRAFEIIGEATKRVPDDFKSKYPEVPWKKMAGM